jgi:ubiquinone/menaquinone biosynthesis C-methylase UbiE
MNAPRDPVAAAYDRWAASYDHDDNPTRDLDARVLREHGPDALGREVLELGGGTGKNTVWLATRASRVVSIDLSPAMQAPARDKLLALGLPAERVAFVTHDLRTRWPIADEAVDLVIGNLVLEHVARLAPVFAESARVLRPGGTLWLAELHPERQRRGGQAHFTDRETGDVVRVPAHPHSVSDFVNGAIAAGLRVRRLGEWHDPGAAADALPRLLTLRAKK